MDNGENLIKGIASKKMNRNEREYKVVDDAEAILQKPVLKRNQEKMANILSLLVEIPKFKDKKLDEQPDTRDIPELESEESAEQKGI